MRWVLSLQVWVVRKHTALTCTAVTWSRGTGKATGETRGKRVTVSLSWICPNKKHPKMHACYFNHDLWTLWKSGPLALKRTKMIKLDLFFRDSLRPFTRMVPILPKFAGPKRPWVAKRPLVMSWPAIFANAKHLIRMGSGMRFSPGIHVTVGSALDANEGWLQCFQLYN